jgi:8-hydroxy-5-deazaflavin:NADPH oxidoreductase
MRIGFVGYGSMAEALAGNWVGKHDLFIGGRNEEAARALAERLGNGVEFGSSKDAARFGDVIVLAVRHDAVRDVIEQVGADLLDEKIVLDINNPIDRETFLPKEEFGPSMGEFIASRIPNSRVAKAFNMCQADVWRMPDPTFDGRRLVVLYCGHDKAKDAVERLIRDTGCEPLDLGGIEKSRLLEPAAGIVIQLLFSGRDHRTVLNVIQPEVQEP